MTILVDKQEVAALNRAINRLSGKKKISREQRLKKLLDVADKVDDLRVDYIIIGDEKAYVIERKEISDLLGSLREGRFWNQLRNIKIVADDISREYGVPAYALLIVEGNVYQQMRKKRGRLTYPQWIGILAGVAEMGVGVIQTGSFDGSMGAIELLNKRAGKSSLNKYRNVSIRKENFTTDKEEAVWVISVIKGLGVKKAVKLLEKYGSVKDVTSLNKDILEKEIGKKTGAHAWNVFNYNFKKDKSVLDFDGGVGDE